ncbi:hypothetical protein [Paraburkholderia sp. MM6662-R1]|uniref:hypothetical protein n=1 Tax=Paraburkholderia sp. MM6662-R1 TaxID=2991066 RepID=UPI003D20C493
MRYAIENPDGSFKIDLLGNLFPNVSFAGGAPSATWLADNHVYPVADDIQFDALTKRVEVEPYLDGDVVRTARAEPVTDDDTIATAYVDALQRAMDAAARSRGYDDIKSGITYLESSIPTFAAEARAMRDWRDAMWGYGLAEIAAVRSGEKRLPALAMFTAGMPQIEWPAEQTST